MLRSTTAPGQGNAHMKIQAKPIFNAGRVFRNFLGPPRSSMSRVRPSRWWRHFVAGICCSCPHKRSVSQVARTSTPQHGRIKTHLDEQEQNNGDDGVITAPLVLTRNVPAELPDRQVPMVKQARPQGRRLCRSCARRGGQLVDPVADGQGDDGVPQAVGQIGQDLEGELCGEGVRGEG